MLDKEASSYISYWYLWFYRKKIKLSYGKLYKYKEMSYKNIILNI